MPETPDFDQIARQLVDGAFEDTTTALTLETYHRWRQALTRIAAEQLRLVWNARGAADLARVEQELSTAMGVTMAGPYVKNLDRAIRALDRQS